MEKDTALADSRRLNDKLANIEREYSQKRSEHETEKFSMQAEINEFQSELNTLRANNKVYEEKAKLSEADRSKQD